jgi:C4-type Zn-finger protein
MEADYHETDYCPLCDELRPLHYYHRGTRYIEDILNYATACEECMQIDKEEVKGMHREYQRSATKGGW